jgi:hypothetical protein
MFTPKLGQGRAAHRHAQLLSRLKAAIDAWNGHAHKAADVSADYFLDALLGVLKNH